MQVTDAVLLIGATGSGKSPLGDWLESRGLWGRRCCHFDFGARLRSIAEGCDPRFTADEIRFIRDVLHSGALLENESFPLALRILNNFVADRKLGRDDLLIMNGLPRHRGQAAAIARHVAFIAVVELKCPAPIVQERVRQNSGGDRTDRPDDTGELIGRKLALFEQRTRPLLDFYRSRSVPVVPLEVGSQTGPSELCAQLADRPH
jgi:adenylate kinase